MAPKYRQRGYKEEEKRQGDRSKGKPKDKDVFRGRSEGRYKEQVFRCHECNQKILVASAIGVGDTCSKCSLDLHCCKNCNFFSPTARFECRKNIPQRIPKKVKRNECTFFTPRIVLDLIAPKTGTAAADDARKAFDNLFKK